MNKKQKADLLINAEVCTDLARIVMNNFNNAYYAVDRSRSFGAFRSRCIGVHDYYNEEMANIDKAIAALEAKHMYSKEYIETQRQEKTLAVRRTIDESRRTLKKELAAILEARRAKADEYFGETPSESVIAALNMAKMRNQMSQKELELLVAKCGTNAQALSIAREIALENNLYFNMPHTFESYEKAENKCVELCEEMIEAVGTNDVFMRQNGSYYGFKYVNSGSYTDTVFDNADYDAAVALAKEPTLAQKVNNELNTAAEKEDFSRFVDVGRFALKYGDRIQTDADLEAAQEAEIQAMKADAEKLGI